MSNNINNPSFNVDQNGNLQGDSEQFSSNSWLSDATNTIASAIDSLVANGVYSYYDNSGSYIVQTMRSNCLTRATQVRYNTQTKTVEVRYLSSGQWSVWSSIGGGSALNYKGSWNASTNTPTLTSSVGTVGDLYIVSVAGTTNLDNINNWTLGDQVIFSSANKWTRIPAGNVDIVTAGVGISVDNSIPNESIVSLIPPTTSVIGGVKASTRPAGQFVTGISTTDGSLTFETPTGSVQSVTGNIVNNTDSKNPIVNLPISQSNVLGGIKTGTRANGQFVTGFDATGLATYATPTGAVVSVSAGFGLEPDSTSTATNPILRTKQSTNDYSTNRSGLDVVTLSSGIYRTAADINNPTNSGSSIWLVNVIKGDNGSSVQNWYSADPNSISSFFTRSAISGNPYSSFERVTIDGVVSLSGNLVTNGNTSAPSVNLLPAGTTAIGGVIAGSPTAPSEQFVQGVNTDGTLKYAIPSASGVRAVVSIDFSGNVPTSSVSDEIISFAFSSDFSAILNGETWIDVQPSIVLFNTLFQVNSTTLLAGTNGGIYRSTDSGSTWSSISNTRSNSFNAFIFQSGSTTNIFAGADNAIWRSTDSGVTWTNTGGRPGVMAFTYFTIDSTNNLVAGATGGTLHYSADGNSWSTVQVASSGAAINTLFATSTTILAGADGIYSSNNLSTWSGIAGVSNTLTFKAFYLLGTDIFASSGIGVWKSSTSSPTNWSLVNGFQSRVTGFLSLGSALFAVSDYGIYKSTNNGVTWGSVIQSGSFSSLINAGTQLVAASNDGTGIYLSKPATFSVTLPAHNSYAQQTITFAPTVNSNASSAITSLQNLIAATRATYTFNTVGTTLNVDTNSSGNITDTTLVLNGTIAGTVTLTIMNGGTSNPLPTITITDPRSGGGSFAYSPAAGSSNVDFCNKISVGENLPNYWFSVTGYNSTVARLLLESISYGNITGLEPTVTITNQGNLSYVRTIISTGSGINGGGGGGGSGSVNSVSAGFGLELNSNSTPANPIIQTKQTTNDYSTNRDGLDDVSRASGIYRTVADATNPVNSGTASWVVTVYEGDTNSGSTQYWSLLNSTPKIFVRSVSTNNVYGSFVEITGQGDDYVLPPATQLNLGGIKTGTFTTGQFVTGFDANGVTQYASLPIATATGLGVVKGNSGTTGQFVNGIAADGSLQYATPTPTPSLIFSQRNARDLFSTSAVSNGNTTVTFGVDVTGLYMPGYKFAFLPRPTSTIFTVVSATFSNGVSTVTFTPAANDTYPSGTQMWEIAQNTPTIVAEGAGIEFDEEGSLTIIGLNPANATTLGGISTGSPTTGQFVQGVNSDGSLKYAIPTGTPYNLPVEMVSMPTATGVDYIVDQSSAQAQTVTAIVENINPTSTIRLNTDIPDFPNDRYVALTDTTGRLIIGIYATTAATGLGYAVVNSLRQSRDHLFTATGNYTMTAYLLVTGTSSILTSGGFSTIPSTRTSQITFGAGINATVGVANPNAIVLDSRQSNWTVGNVGDPTFIENKFTNNAWITGVIKTSGSAAIGDDSVEVTGNFTSQIIPNTSTIRFGATDTQNYNVTSVSYIQPSNTTSITFEPTLQTAQASGTNVRLLSALTPASMTFDTTQFYLESDVAGKQTIRAIAGQAINAVLLGTNTYSTADISAINGGNGKFTLGSNATGAIEMSTKTLVSSPIALPLTAAQTGIQVGVHVLPSPSATAVVSTNNVNFVNNILNPSQNILSPNAQTMAGAVAAGSVIVSSDLDEDNALWIMIDYSDTDFKLVKLSFSNYSTTPTFISSNVFTIVAPSQQFIGEINEFGITKVSTGNYKIVMTGTAVGAPSDASRVYQATVTLDGSTLTVNTPSVLGPQLPNAVYCTKISNTYGTYAASLSGGQIWKLNSTSTAWNLLYTINPSDQSSQMQIDRATGYVWVAFDTEEVIRIDQNNNVTQFPKSTLLNWTNVDQGQNTWGIIANGQTASIITYATLTSTSVNANYLLLLSTNAVVKVLDDLQLTNQIIDSVGSQGTSGQVLTVVNNNPTWASTRNVLVFQLAANTGSTAQATIPFPATPFITIGKPFGTMNNGVFTASRNVNVRMDFVYNVNATVDAWGAVNANWTTGNRYMQLSSNDLKGSVSQIVPMNAGDTFQYRANNAVQWFGGSGTGTYLEMEALD